MRVILFIATWCKSYVDTTNAFQGAAKRFGHSRFNFEAIDVETERGVEMSCIRNVRNAPTILVLNKKGKEIERLSGNITYDSIVSTIKKYMK